MVGDLVDRAITSPINDLMGGYYVFLRRLLLPAIFILIFLLVFDISNGSSVLAAIITGGSLGPVLLLEQWFIIRLAESNAPQNPEKS
ncbi:MAG: Uncharacterised protein [Methanobacteriota archaeon]|nr:MAG: hypothetical protein CBE15_06535 [Euryarchaeota archaeon TMED255]RAH11577.1 MAG: hypothetical protein CMA23_001675 [Euryarchaeota archaeon]CAI8214491.1 MAG: Uncharacterised protein [Euryarchaeota archaeon]|tara:strand:+ start:1297 stop:1557 length:261 start_codon:yes stop_codon:yes gene_type:complete